MRLAIEKIARELGEGENLEQYRSILEHDSVADDT